MRRDGNGQTDSITASTMRQNTREKRRTVGSITSTEYFDHSVH